MPRDYESSMAVCPFYRSETPDTILCEGLDETGNIRLLLGDKDTKQKHRARCCCLIWRDCPLAEMLWTLKINS